MHNTSDDGMRSKEQHEGKGKGWTCNNHNMHNPIKKMQGGVTHVMVAFAFMLLLTSHAIITGVVHLVPAHIHQ